MVEGNHMSDNFIAGTMSLMAGGAVATQGAGLEMPISEIMLSTVLAMMATGLVTWGMFKKATEQNEKELKLLRNSLTHMIATLTEVRIRVARIEGRLGRRTVEDGSNHTRYDDGPHNDEEAFE